MFIYLIILRLVHGIASVCWAGGSFIFFLFVEPTAKAVTPNGMQFVDHMAGKGRFNIFMVISSTLTLISGVLLLWQDASGQWLEWLQTGPGLGFGIGSLIGIVVYGVGMFGVKPRVDRLGAIGKEIEAAGGPPTQAQLAELQKLDKELSSFSRIDFILVAISLVLMATARYWFF